MTFDISELSSVEVVIMEDDLSSQRFLQGALRNFGISHIYVANTAEQVVQYAERGNRVNYILDINLGADRDQEGLDALEMLRERSNNIFVAVWSSFPRRFRKQAKKLGATVFQEKTANRGADINTIVGQMLRHNEKHNSAQSSVVADDHSGASAESGVQQDPSELPIVASDLEANQLVLQTKSLEDLLNALMEIPELERASLWWLDDICSNAVTISTQFIGAPSVEDFLEYNFSEAIDVVVDLKLQNTPDVTVGAMNIAMMALYPSKAVRSIPADISIEAKQISVRLSDLLVLLDPDEDQPITDIPSFIGSLTLFAVNCQ